MPPGFVRLSNVAPTIKQDIRYAGANNFMGRKAPGYNSPQCWLRREAAHALAQVQDDLKTKDESLIVFDCYRPNRTSAAFFAWAMDPNDQIAKQAYYPDIDKTQLFALGYIARQSSHSTGLTVDLAIDGLDFGTPFDYFDPRSATANSNIPPQAAANRKILVETLRKRGFSNYAEEWWHFTYQGVQTDKMWDVEIK
jgi:D-alanyl-D-alanine dipeptidase